MDAESFAKAAAITAPYDPAYCGSKPLNPKPTPPSSSPSSTAVPASKTSSMLAPITSVPRFFGSLLYEACGRIVNPIYGAAGLLWSGNWHLCHAAVEAVLHGSPIVQLSPDSELSTMSPPLKACDIRHVSKDESSAASRDLHKVKCRSQFKRAAGKPKVEVD
ncbi:LOB domain-containing protein 41-like [Camellia sinensis]|uniref:LOB domain-containing protein 41-like n=1 Tax=Camellia sinensis TaxID=4442 RepID=UPI001035CA1B|nr:LOB domain-containing protein 41-like [Camellia sinensis]